MWLVVERGSGRVQVAEDLTGTVHQRAGRQATVCTEERAQLAVRALATDPQAEGQLRQLVRGLAAGSDLGRLGRRELAAQLSLLVRQRRLRVCELERVMVGGTGAGGEGKTAKTAEKETLESITYQVVDDLTGEPIAGAALSVTLPNGKEVDKSTDGKGIVRFDDLKPGRCSVRAKLADRDLLHVLAYVGFGPLPLRQVAEDTTVRLWDRPTVHDLKRKGKRKPKSEPAHLVAVTEHKVKTGETLDSIAEQHGTTSKKLEHFNFGTNDPKEVQRHLAREVGTTLRDLETGAYLFSSGDTPGIIYVPRQWEAAGQMTDRDHVIRVRRIEPHQPPYVFSL